MGALKIGDLGDERKPALAEKVKDEGSDRARVGREWAFWVPEAREGLAYEAEHLVTLGLSLAHYRGVLTGSAEQCLQEIIKFPV
ncbi:MAG: hypothetical protein U1E34_12680 [Amaricoccus sp.]